MLARTFVCLALSLTLACASSESAKTGDATSSNTPCHQLCKRPEGQKCSADKPAECASQCDNLGSIPSACKAASDATISCNLKATEFICDSDNESQGVGCDDEEATLDTCLQNNGGSGGAEGTEATEGTEAADATDGAAEAGEGTEGGGPVCDNGTCEETENCENCLSDCPCADGMGCTEGACLPSGG